MQKLHEERKRKSVPYTAKCGSVDSTRTTIRKRLARRSPHLIVFLLLMAFVAQWAPVPSEAAQPFDTYLGQFRTVEARSNNGHPTNRDNNYINHWLYGTNVLTGIRWECVEYMRRFYLSALNLHVIRTGGPTNDGRYWFENAGNIEYMDGPSSKVGFDRFSDNTVTRPPAAGDILGYDGSVGGGSGHVAIIKRVRPGYILTAQQNWDNESSDLDRRLTLTSEGNHYNVSGTGIQGWLRPRCDARQSNSMWHPDGTLLVEQNGTVWFIEYDPIDRRQERRLVPDEWTFVTRGWSWCSLIKTTTEELNAYPIGAQVSNSERIIRRPDGAIFRVNDRGYKQGFNSMRIFDGLGYSMSEVEQANSSQEVDQIPDDPASPHLSAPFPDGTLVRNGSDTTDQTVYVITDGGRRAFSSPDAFGQLGYDFNRVLAIDSGTFDQMDVKQPPIDECTVTQACGGGFDEFGPNLSITSHTNGQTVTTSSVTISGTASDAGRGESGIASVTVNGVRANGDTASVSNTANWSRTITLNPGANTITVVATDNASMPNQTSQVITLNLSSGGGTNVQVTIQTNPASRSFTVDGTLYTSAQTFTWVSAATHSISTTSPQSGGTGTQYQWSGWSDGWGLSHNVSPSANTTYTASFTTLYFLTMNAGTGGTVSPLSNWISAGQSVTISAFPNNGFTFTGWIGSGVGSFSGSGNPATLIMNGPITETASFAINPTPSPTPTPSQSGTKIAFTRGFNESAEIYSMSADGSGQVNLTNNSVNDEYPTWSPDGKKIAFVSWRDGNKEIYVMDADGNNQRNLTHHYEYDLDPAWSPDGSKIAFHSYRDGNAEIYVMNADGSNPTRLTYSDQTIDSEAAWSPDGSKIIFQRFENFNVDIYVMNVDGSDLRNLTNFSGQSSKPSWSPAGTKIAFSRDGLYLMNADGSNQTNITGTSFNGGDPTWSPDGTRIAFSSSRDGNSEIYVMNADGNNQTRLTNSSDYDYDPAWGPSAASNPSLMNFALASNGGLASASSTLDSGRLPSAANNGDRKGIHWGSDPLTGSGWHDATSNIYPDWLEIDLSGPQNINEIDVFTVQDNYSNPIDPNLSTTFSAYGITAFDVQYWNGSSWVTVTGGSVTGNNKVWRQFTFASAIQTAKIRVLVNNSLAGYSRITEVEAWGPGSPPSINVALTTNGGVASASSTLDSGRLPLAAINGDRRGSHWGTDPSTGSGWHDATSNSFPDFLQVDFNGSKTINEIDVFSVQDNYTNPAEPTDAMTFSLYGLTIFDLQYWDGSSWVTVPGGSVSGNNLVRRKVTFSPISTTKIRVLVNAALAGYSRITEVEAWTAPNVALASNGGVASASSTLDSGRLPSAANNGDRKGIHWGSDPSTGSGWHDATANSYPDFLQIDFNGSKSIAEIDVFSVQDNYANPSEPTDAMTFSLYGITTFDVQYWDGSSWVTVPGGSVIGNNLVKRKFSFAPITTTKIRILVNSSLAGYSRIVEVEAY